MITLILSKMKNSSYIENKLEVILCKFNRCSIAE